MSTQRGRIKITGFHSEKVTDRESISDWSDDKKTEIQSRWVKVAREIRRDRLALIGGSVVFLMLFTAMFARPLGPVVWPSAITQLPLAESRQLQPFSLAPYDPTSPLVGGPYEGPSLSHPMGTDNIGRDMLSRVMFGTRYSVTIGIVVTAIAATFGVVYGGISGYFGGRIDDVLMRVVDLVFAFPGLVLALVIVAMLGGGYWQLVAAFTLVGWAGYARLIRGEILKVKQNEYVLAAKAMGARDSSVLFRHVIPNAIAPVIVQATLSIGTVVIGVAALGFLGVGFDPGTPEWGTMLEGERDTVVSASGGWTRWWVTVFPGLMIFLFVMSMNMVGDAVNDALDAQSEDTTTNMGGG